MLHERLLAMYDMMVPQAKLHALLSVAVGGVSVGLALLAGRYLSAVVLLVAHVMWYLVFSRVMHMALAMGYNNVAWVVAFQPVVDQLLLAVGLSLVRGTVTFLAMLLKNEQLKATSRQLKQNVVSRVMSSK